jgi:hypothetical protein
MAVALLQVSSCLAFNKAQGGWFGERNFQENFPAGLDGVGCGARLREPQQRPKFRASQLASKAFWLAKLLRVTDPRSVFKLGNHPKQLIFCAFLIWCETVEFSRSIQFSERGIYAASTWPCK